ncbi:unnamed protein product [Pleuronectes platessa]|uniref:Uncharacterized protein n=1 Tax=Pleuronectes platessa TaxID=8262 RepID=A0A9N7U2F5_PLEPL|nr:unnamed protein product [Pleuronectes platessa]
MAFRNGGHIITHLLGPSAPRPLGPSAPRPPGPSAPLPLPCDLFASLKVTPPLGPSAPRPPGPSAPPLPLSRSIVSARLIFSTLHMSIIGLLSVAVHVRDTITQSQISHCIGLESGERNKLLVGFGSCREFVSPGETGDETEAVQ